MDRPLPGFEHLLQTVARLRAPDGCPWDREQTERTMAPHLLEEAYEAADAIGAADDAAIDEELGDVLVNIALIAQMRMEHGRPGADVLAQRAADKLVRRHPHVFGDAQADGAEMAYRQWEQQKRREAGAAPRSVLAGVPRELPALLRAFRVGEKAARVGFDWPDRQGPRAKIDEELRELDEAIGSGDAGAIEHELGDVLFSLCNLARHLRVQPEMALRRTVARFQARFERVEQELGPDLRGRTLDEMEAAWQRAKLSEG